MECSTETDRLSSGTPGVASPPDFESLNHQLTAVNEIVGHVFLELSQTLQRIADQARSVVELSTAAAKLAAASESEQQFQKLSGVVEITERLEQLAETSQQRLTNIQRTSAGSRISVVALEKIPPTLITIGTLSRIESGRIQGTQVDIKGLATNITELANKVDTNIGTISRNTAKLAQIVSSGTSRIGNIADQEKQRAHAITNRAQGILTARRCSVQTSNRAIADIDERYKQIRGAIEAMVISLQAQDIARQRLEHVQQVFQQLSTSGMIDKELELARVLTLQRSQVASTRDYITNSIESILSSLGSVRDQLNSVSADATAALNQVDESGNSLDSAMKAALLEISSEVDRHRDSVRATMSVVKTLIPWLATIRQCVAELKQVESGIRRTALNARIETSHLGSEGAAMRALASELQTTTEGSKGHIQRLLESVLTIETEIATLSEIEISGDDVAVSTATSKRELDRLCEEVVRTHDFKTDKLKELIGETESLKVELQSGIERTINSQNVREAFDNIHRELVRALARLGSTGEISPARDPNQISEEFTALYSMQSERDLHEQVFGRLDMAHQQPPAADSNDGLGDGIELF